MMLPAAVLAHAGLGLVATAAAGLSPRPRAVVIRSCCAGGIVAGLWLVVLGDPGQRWRTIVVAPPEATLAGIAIACAWLLVAAGDGGRGRWVDAALTGVASSGLALAVSGRWVVPVLMFWMCGSLAIAVWLRETPSPGSARAALFGSDALVVAALIGASLHEATWALGATSGWPASLLVAAGLVRAGVVPRVGVWALLRSPAVPAVPLLVAGAFALGSGRLAGAHPWVAVALLVGVLGLAARGLVHGVPRVTVAAAWPVALGLAISMTAPRATASAGVAAVLAVCAIALWPSAAGRGQVERGLLVAFVPATAGFGALAVAVAEAFDTAVSGIGAADAAAWAAAGALLPLAMLSGVVLGARWGRRPEPETFAVGAVIATWALLAAALALGVAPPVGIGTAPVRLVDGDVTILHGAAVAAAGVGALAARRRGEKPPLVPPPHRGGPVVDVIVPSGRLERVASWTATAVGAAALAAAAAFLVEGLQKGFL